MCNPRRLGPGIKAIREVKETENEIHAVKMWTSYPCRCPGTQDNWKVGLEKEMWARNGRHLEPQRKAIWEVRETKNKMLAVRIWTSYPRPCPGTLEILEEMRAVRTYKVEETQNGVRAVKIWTCYPHRLGH